MFSVHFLAENALIEPGPPSRLTDAYCNQVFYKTLLPRGSCVAKGPSTWTAERLGGTIISCPHSMTKPSSIGRSLARWTLSPRSEQSKDVILQVQPSHPMTDAHEPFCSCIAWSSMFRCQSRSFLRSPTRVAWFFEDEEKGGVCDDHICCIHVIRGR